MFRPSAALLPSRSFAGLEKRLVAALFCLAGRSGKRNENESDETSSIPPNFQSEAVQRAAVWVRCTQGAGGVAASWMDAGTELGQRDGAGTWGHIHVTLVWTRSPAHTVQGLRRREKDWGTESAHPPPPPACRNRNGTPKHFAFGTRSAYGEMVANGTFQRVSAGGRCQHTSFSSVQGL